MPTKSSSSSSGGSSSSSSSSPSRTMTTTNCGASRMAATATNGGPKIAATSRIQINAAPPSSTTVDQKTCARKSPKATTMAGANATSKDGGHRRKKSRSDVQSDFLSKIANLESKDNSITDSSELREDRSETQLDSESNVKISATTESIATYDNGKFEQAYNLQSESGNQPKRSTMNLHSFIPKLENPNLYHEVSNEYPDAMQSPSSQITENSLDEDQIMSIKNQENQFASNLSTQLYYNNPTQSQVFSPCIKSQNYETIENLCTQMGYRIYQENGQRKFCSPEYDTIKLEKGCEVFIGKIPRDCFEDELVPILSNVGKIHELRLMMDFSGTTRGFGFVSYFSPDEAQKAVAHLNNYEIRPGVFIGVCLSIDNCRLFIGGIPKFKTKQEIFDEMSKITDDVVDVIVYPSVNDKMKNRGFAFVEYQTHRAAAMARRRLIPGKISLWGSTVAVDWAEPELDVPRGIMSTVKILYVRNLMLFTTEESLYHIFANAAECDVSDIERVRKLRDFCFVHFTKREDALQAMEKINGTQIDGSTVEVSLAKPVDKTTHYYNRFHRMHHNHAHNNNHNGNGTNNVMYGGGSFIKNANSLINPHYMRFYNGNNLPRNAAGNVNRHLNPNQPDGVYHQPTSQIFRPQIVGPMQAPAPNVAGIENELMFFNNNQHQRFPTLPVNQPHQQPNVSGSFFSCVKLLEDICYANHWGSPSYDLSIYTTQSGVFYSFHVNIPNLIKFFSKELLASVDCDEFGTFSAKDFIVGLEEAKEICAGRIISCLDSLSQKNVIKSPSTNQETNQLSSNQNDENVELRNMLNTSDVLQSLKLHQTNKNQYDYNSNQEVNADDVNDDATTTSEINVNNNNNETSRSDSFSQYHVYADKAQLATKR